MPIFWRRSSGNSKAERAMAELTTIARPYAEAAFRIGRDANALPTWSAMLALLGDIAADPRAAAALDNPKLTAADKAALVLSIAGQRLDANGRNFVRVLVDAGRFGVLPQIRTLFEALKNGTDGVSKARIDTAFPLTEAQAADLKAALEKRFGTKIETTVNVDPALGGGARITVGDTVIDGTIEAQLAAMATHLRA
jgi:F-type H+-transporting ATPase subunit delta